MICKRILITGRVQGVFFRASAKEMAERLGLSGEVRNLDNGMVEVIAYGPEDAVDRMVEWCRQGPPRAEVDSVEVTEVSDRVYEGFKVRR